MQNEREVSWGKEPPNLKDSPNGAIYIQTTDEPLTPDDERFISALAAMFRCIPVQVSGENTELEG